MGEFIGVHTLRDEYHKALERRLSDMLATEEVKLKVRWMHNHMPDVYISLSVIAHRCEPSVFSQAVNIAMHINK